jgi:hypothetical protein
MTTVHTRQLQQHTRPTNNNYTQDKLKLATKHTRQIRIQHVQKVKTPQQDSTVYSFLLLFFFRAFSTEEYETCCLMAMRDEDIRNGLFLIAWLHGYVVAWLRGCVVMWLHGYVVAWLCGCVVMWLRDYVVWLCGCVVTWLRGEFHP